MQMSYLPHQQESACCMFRISRCKPKGIECFCFLSHDLCDTPQALPCSSKGLLHPSLPLTSSCADYLPASSPRVPLVSFCNIYGKGMQEDASLLLLIEGSAEHCTR